MSNHLRESTQSSKKKVGLTRISGPRSPRSVVRVSGLQSLNLGYPASVELGPAARLIISKVMDCVISDIKLQAH